MANGKAAPIRAGKASRLAIDDAQDRNAKVVTVAGAGILGLWQALTLARAGHRVTLVEKSEEPFADAASRWAGAMLAPDCEAEAAPRIVRDLGRRSVSLWQSVDPGLAVNGTLVVAAARDAAELKRFASLTERHRTLDAGAIAALEPALAGRFSQALLYPDEAHMDGVGALDRLLDAVRAAGVEVDLGTTWHDRAADSGIVVDCRGYAASPDVPALRGVRGERLLAASADVALERPVRLLHPRQPIYVVPQGDGRFVIGATVIERDDARPMTVRSALELLGSAYALHPGFGEARILDAGAGVRPAFPDNVPRVRIERGGRMIRVNGAYRHGFLLAPVLAEAVADYLKSGAQMPLLQAVS